MKIRIGDVAVIESDPEPRNTEWHRAIVSHRPILNTQTGKMVDLECGHVVMTFGALERVGGRVLCTACRDGQPKGKE